MNPDHPDGQLAEDYLEGDKESLDVLIKRYLKPIYSFTYRYAGNAQDAEDITQDTFVKVWRNLHKFNSQRSRFAVLNRKRQKSPAPYRTNEMSSGSGFKTWVFQIAKNTAIDFLKKSRSASGGKKAIPFSEFDTEEGGNLITDTLADPSPLPGELLERAGMAQTLASAMEKLSPKYRMVLFLRYNDHFNFREIAESLGEPLDTVKSRHRRALIILKNLIQEA